ncbi:hypothetical protein RHSIM_RhsimUnG0127300 [Rhododendron simsii]|uniref:FBD domain-containing protein n=1 Tax=Rhododendron simsii TaxID=118357 RepID=A0A834FW22_RHOSS|nr:hypothetical protein RHSIM_RhsimUnG0127300 [Rhododendron simsii]
MLEDLSVRLYCSSLGDVHVIAGPNSNLSEMIPVSIKNAPLLAQLEIGGLYSNRLLSDLGRSEDFPDLRKRISQRKPMMAADISCFRPMDPNFPLPSRHHHNQNFLYQCLETVELVGFSGHPAELELAIYLLENAALRLQRITIDPQTQHFASDAFLADKVPAAREILGLVVRGLFVTLSSTTLGLSISCFFLLELLSPSIQLNVFANLFPSLSLLI